MTTDLRRSSLGPNKSPQDVRIAPIHKCSGLKMAYLPGTSNESDEQWSEKGIIPEF